MNTSYETFMTPFEIEQRSKKELDQLEADYNQAKLWVTLTDEFMSGWGRSAFRKNRLAFCCKNREEAEKVMKNAYRRIEFKYVYLCGKRPREKNHQFLQFQSPATMPKMYE